MLDHLCGNLSNTCNDPLAPHGGAKASFCGLAESTEWCATTVVCSVCRSHLDAFCLLLCDLILTI